MFWVVELGVALYLLLDIVAQLLPPHYSPISQAESDLAVGPYGYVMTVNFVNRGLLSLAFLYAFARVLRRTGLASAQYSRGLALMGVWAVGALLLAVFPTDVPATPATPHGEIHLLVATLAFLGGAFGELVLSLRLARSGTLRGARFALPISVLAVISCLIVLGLPFVAPHIAARIGGLAERVMLGLILLWMAAVSRYLLRGAIRVRTGTRMEGPPSPPRSPV